jgi:hypothetical protein
MVQTITETELREAFWNNVILTGDTKRLVARAPKLDGDSTGPSAPMEIFVPTNCGAEFDLVLSLCEDGTQRITVDFDAWKELLPHGALGKYNAAVMTINKFHEVSATIVTPSTENWHIWGTAPTTWDDVRVAFSSIDNHGYMGMNSHKGFCGLRPPWKNKWGTTFHDAIRYRWDRPPDRDMFAGIDWTRNRGGEQYRQELPSLEDLFAQEKN